jgi:ABC-2 type transport system ATP-binding protein
MQNRSSSTLNPNPLIETSHLTKKFGDFYALSDLNLGVLPGEIYGLLGPNGAGKTTTIKSILGLLEPSSGWIKVAGLSPTLHSVEVKSNVGYVAENPLVYDSLSPRDFLEFVGSIRKLNRGHSKRVDFQLSKRFWHVGVF